MDCRKYYHPIRRKQYQLHDRQYHGQEYIHCTILSCDDGVLVLCAMRPISILLQSKKTLHHASMDMNLINLPRRSLHLTSKDTISFSNKGLDASIITTMMHDNGTSGVGTPSITARSPWTKVMGDILDILILHITDEEKK